MSETTDKIKATVRALMINCLETDALSISYVHSVDKVLEDIDLRDTTMDDLKRCTLSKKKDKNTKEYMYHLKIVVEKE
jgi:hypothetical protein